MSESELVPTGRWVSSPEVGYCPVMSSSSPAANAGLVRITYLGQSTFRFTTPESRTVLIDPWTVGNPLCPPEEERVREVDLILITHGHHDHLGDVFTIARELSPKIVTIVELGKWLGSKGLKNPQTMNIGGIEPLE